MAVNIGPRIGIDGEAEYRKQMQNIIQQAKTLDAEMKKVTASFDKNTTAEEKAKAVGEVLQKQIEVQKKRVEELQKGLEESTKKYGESDTATLKWKEALNAAEANLAKMEKGLDETGKATADYTKQADGAEKETDTFHDTLKALAANEGIKKGFEALSNTMKAVGTAIVDAGKAAAKSFVDTAEWADGMNTLAKETGLSTDTLQEFEYMSDLTDTDLSTVQSSLQKLTKSMSGAKNGTGAAADTFKMLGVSVTNADGSLRDNEEVFYDTIDALGKMQNETERDAASMAIFGRSALELNPLIETGGAQMRAFAEEAHSVGYVLDEEALGALNQSKDAFDRLKNAGTALERQFGAELAPTIAGVAENLVDMVQNDEELRASLTDIVTQLGKIVQEIAPVLIPLISELLPIISQIASDVLPPILELTRETMPYVSELCHQLLPVISKILQTIMPFVIKLVGAILPPILKILTALCPVISALLDFLVPILDLIIEIIDPLLEVIGDCLSPIITLLQPLIQLLGSVLTPILKDLAPLIEVAFWPLKAIVIPLINGVCAALKTMIGWIKDAVNWFNSLFNATNKANKSTGGASGSFRSVATPTVRSSAPLRSAPVMASLADSNDMITRGAGDLVDLVRPMMSFAMSGADTNPFFGGGSGRIPVPAGGQVLNNNNVTNYGGVTIEVNAAPGQDVNSIANAVMDKLQYAVRRREAVYQ